MKQVSLKELQNVLLKMLIDFDAICQKNNIMYSLAFGTLLGAVRHKGFIPWDDDIDVCMTRDNFEKFHLISEDEFSKLGYTLQKSLSDSWPMGYSKLCMNNTTYIEDYLPKNEIQHLGVFIDIFPVDDLSNNRIMQRLQYFSCRLLTAKGLKKRGYNTKSFIKKIGMCISSIVPTEILHRICCNNFTKKTMYKNKCIFSCVIKSYNQNIYPSECFSEYVYLNFENHKFHAIKGYKRVLKIYYGDYMTIPSKEEQLNSAHAKVIDFTRTWSRKEIEELIKNKKDF